MNDVDRYDFVISITGGLIMAAIILVGGPLWVVVPIGMITVTISLYRHLPLPPRRR
jgi:hypothetical protein